MHTPENVRKNVCERGPDPYEEALHREPGRALIDAEFVRDESPKWFHTDVDVRIQNPEQTRRHPQHGRVRHEKERDTRENRSRQKVRTTTAQTIPGAIAH